MAPRSSACGRPSSRALVAHHQKGLAAGAGHHAVEQMDGVADDAAGHVLVQRQRLLHHGQRVLQRVGALGHRDAAEVLALRAELAHVVGGDEGEDRVRPAGAIGVAGVAREGGEAAQHEPERIDVVGVARQAGHDVGVARLHRARGAAQRHHAGSAAVGNEVQPARRDAQVLRHAHGGVGAEREAADGEAVDLVLRDARLAHQRFQRLAQEPVRAVGGIALVGHRHRHGDGNAFVAEAPGHATLFFMARVSMQCAWPGSCCAIVRSSPRWIFCEAVSGSASTKAT